MNESPIVQVGIFSVPNRKAYYCFLLNY